MQGPQSLDELIATKAAEFADQLQAVSAMADKEEEIRIAAERQLAFIEREAGVELEGRHEFTVAKGRIDSVYSRVVIEYKNPSSSGARIGPRTDSPGCKKVVQQIKQRFQALRDEHGHQINSLFGVGLDGKHFVFVRFRDNKWDVQDPVEVNKHSAERFLWALFNLGHKGKPFSPTIWPAISARTRDRWPLTASAPCTRPLSLPSTPRFRPSSTSGRSSLAKCAAKTSTIRRTERKRYSYKRCVNSHAIQTAFAPPPEY
jgi:hypothetical protein